MNHRVSVKLDEKSKSKSSGDKRQTKSVGDAEDEPDLGPVDKLLLENRGVVATLDTWFGRGFLQHAGVTIVNYT